MNIRIEKIDDVNAQIIILICNNDIQSAVKKSFKYSFRNEIIPGFRKGNAPQSVFYSKYGNKFVLEELNKLIYDKLSEYIKNNNLILLGDPILNKYPLELKKAEKYEYIFDVGLQPDITINLSKIYRFHYYNVHITSKMVEDQIGVFRCRFSKYSNVSTDFVKKEDVIKGSLIELDDYGIKKKSSKAMDIVLKMHDINNYKEKVQFLKKKVGEVVLFNPSKAFDGDKEKVFNFFKTLNKQIKNYSGSFSLTISEINRYCLAEIDQNLFDQIYGVGMISSVEDFRQKIKEDLLIQWEIKSGYKLLLDAKIFFLEKIKQVKFPEEFLKRWWNKLHLELDSKSSEKKFLNVLDGIKVQCIWNKIMEESKVTITSEDLYQVTELFVRSKFFLYRLDATVDDLIKKYTNKLLKTDNGFQQLYKKAVEIKIIQCLKTKVALNFEMVTENEFSKLSE